MLTNRLLVLGAALGMVVGCGHDDRANAAPKAVVDPAATVAPAPPATPVRHVAPRAVAKRAPASSGVRHAAARPVATPVAKPVATSAAKPAAKSTSAGLVLDVPEAHLPPGGQCRIWKEGTSIFQQPQARSCTGIALAAPAGSMILERPSKDKKVIRVRYVDARHVGVVVRVRVFDALSGKYLRDEKV